MIDDKGYLIKANLYDGLDCDDDIIFYQNDTRQSKIVAEFTGKKRAAIDVADCTVVCVIQKSDKEIVTAYMENDFNVANRAEYVLSQNALASTGKGIITIFVYGSDNERQTFGSIKFKVLKDVNSGSVESTTEYPVLTKLISDTKVVINDAENAKNEILGVSADIANSEKQRVSAETKREENESSRINEFAGIKKEYESLKGIMIDENNAVNLQNQINEANSQLDTIMNYQGEMALNIIDNIDGLINTKNKKINIDYLRTRQIIKYAEFFKKLKTTGYIKICCIGDSLTYGYDVTSGDIRPPIDGRPFTRASVSYPEMLEKCLNEVYADRITVENRGYSGDWCELSYNRWNLKHESDLSIIQLGTNDCIVDIGEDKTFNVEYFIKWYEQIIIRELLWGNPVLILTPPKMRDVKSDYNKKINVMRNALYLLAKKYCINVYDTEEFFRNYKSEIYSDMTHFNTLGYKILGAKVASILIGDIKPNRVSNGTKLGVRPTIDGCVNNTTCDIIESPYGGTTPNETNSLIASFRPGGVIYYSVYSETDDLMVIPILALGVNIPIKVDLLYGLKNGENSIDFSLSDNVSGGTADDNNASEITYLNSTNAEIITKTSPNATFLKLNKGYNVIRISCDGGALNGIEFIDKEMLNLIRK